MVVCKICFTPYGKWRTHCPNCGCASLPNGKTVDVDTMRIITKRDYRNVSKFSGKVSAQ